MKFRINSLSLPCYQTFVRMAGLMLILCYSSGSSRMMAQDKDMSVPKDTAKLDSIVNRDLTENYSPLEKYLPPSPQAAALARYGEYPVSLATGVPEIKIPLYEIKLGNYTLPISISYHASGIKVDDVASTVGLGWVLNAGGSISRTVVGAPDLRENRNETEDTLYRSYDRYHTIYYSSGNAEQYMSIIIPILTDALNSSYDTASDRYSYNFGSKAGVFRYSYEDRRFVTLNHDPILILYNDRSSENGFFTIYDSDGTEYVFRNRERTTMAGSDYMCPTTWYITDINTPYGNIHFKYRTANAYTISQRSESTKVGLFYYYDSSENAILDRYGAENSTGISDYTYSTLLLTEICWNGNKMQFEYSSNRSDVAPERLTNIVVKGCDNSIYKNITLDNDSYLGNSADNYRMMLNTLSISDEGTYSFTYDRNHVFPKYDCISQRDYWGYYNGKGGNHAIPNEAMVAAYSQFPEHWGISPVCTDYADRSPDFSYGKTGILERITYPTGGYTDFTYAQNWAGEDKGGLRINAISDKDNNGTVLRQRTFSYSGYTTQDSPSSALVYDTYHGYRDMATQTIYQRYATCSSQPLTPLVDGNGISVFYEYVTESDLANNYINYHFEYGGLLPAGNNFSQYSWPQFASPSLNDEGACAPLLISKGYSQGNTILRTENYDYDIIRLDSIEVGMKTMNIVSVSSVYNNPTILEMADIRSVPTPMARLNGYIKTYRLNSKTISDYQTGVSITETYTYDPQFRTLQPKSITKTNSDGKVFKTTNTFTFESNQQPYSTMANYYNMVDLIIEKRDSCDNNLLKKEETTYLYQSQNDWYYPEYLYESRLGNTQIERLHLLDYDIHGNPRTIIENGTDKTALVWGFKSGWPVAKIAGLSYTDLISMGLTNTLNTIAQDSMPSRMATYLTALRTRVGTNGLVTTYNYNPLYGVSAITAENGYTTYYDYGSNGKLSAIRDNDGPLQQFSYQYAHPYSGTNDGTNYVQTKDMLSSSTGNTTRQYYDGLGRPIQTAKDGLNTYNLFVFTQQKYDGKGRVSEDWLPAVGNSSINYIGNITGISSTTYGDSHAYSITTYDAIDRPTFTQTPGDAWHSASKGVTKEYVTNAANNVKRYQAALTSNSLIKNGNYSANMLYGELTTDEDGHVLTEFTDKMGHKVLERRGTSNDTYYIYDDLSQLRFVLSPQYQEAGHKDMYGYEYRYDEKGRLVKKILPQCEHTQFWYDTAGRMKFMQDATLRSKNPSLYRFFLYDKFGRLSIQGTCTSCWRGEAVNVATYVGYGGGFQGTGYSVSRSSDIGGTVSIEQVNYYDNYSFLNDLYSNYSLSQNNNVSTIGLLTGTRQTASDGTMLLNAHYYDYKGRVTDTRSTTLANRRMWVKNTYNYWGGVTQTQQYVYSSNGSQELYVTSSNTYHTNTRLLNKTTLGIKIGTGSTNSTTIHEMTYDSLGHVKTDKRGGSTYNTMTYSYDVHGWLKGLSSTAFQEWLYYADAPNGATNCYNGNISVQKWKQGNESFNRGYKFTYNSLNRLAEAKYGESNFSDNLNDYNEKVVEYSANGMIRRFQRRGKKSDGEYGKVDNLHIYLDGNRPVKITDDADLQTVYGAMEFKDGANLSTEYGYDGVGSMIYDANKGIAKIEYDNLNYPRRLQFTNGNTIEYVYTPDGQRLRARYQTATGNVVVPLNTTQTITAASTTQTDYVGGLIYTGTANGSSVIPTLSKILYTDGYFMTTSSTGGVFRYYVKDHLGNNRAVNNGNTVYQRTHYYPFGGPYADVGTASDYQPYKYNGKELDRVHGLDLYDYGARQYDAVVPMFTQVDPMAEKYYHLSPYVYCGNNPVNYVDLHGDSISIDQQSIKAIYNGLKAGSHISMRFDNGVLDPSSISEVAENSDDFFLRDLYEIAKDKQMVELHTDVVNTYIADGRQIEEQWTTPYEVNDYDFDIETQSLIKLRGEPLGKHIQGNLGQTLYPNSGYKRSTNGNIQIIINGKGNLNAQSIGIAHEFGHILLHLRGLPSAHYQPGVDSFVFGRATMMSKRLGYDY